MRKTIFVVFFSLCLVAGFVFCNPDAISDLPVSNTDEETFEWNGHYALVRLEDVHPASDIAPLRKCIKLLKRENVPFSIALIPIYRNPEKDITIYLHEKPELVRLIKESGATIVLHGCTHQYYGETAVDYEFCDKEGMPLQINYTEYTETKIRMALWELKLCNISASIWETPHYKTTRESAKVVSSYFTTTYDEGEKLTKNELGQIVIPTCYYYANISQPAEGALDILDDAQELKYRNDNDTVASFFYHPFLGPKYLKTIIKGLKKQGYRFVSPEEYILSVNPEEIEIALQYPQ